MRKIFLLFVAFVGVIAANAQSSGNKSVVFVVPDAHTPLMNYQLKTSNSKIVVPSQTLPSTATARTTATGGRWYRYFDYINAYLGYPFTNSTAANRTIAPLWWDSSVTYRYSNGIFANEWSGVCQTIDPIRYIEYNDTERTSEDLLDTFARGGDFRITSTDPYIVDSIR